MTNDELERLAKLAEAATEGPWEAIRPQINVTEEDAQFIAAARTALPALVAEVRRLTRELEWVTDERDRLLQTVERAARGG